MDANQDRRLAGRLDKVFSVHICGAWGSSFGIARNISPGGLFIETPDPYPLGSSMQVTFSFPGSDCELTATAQVIHLCFLNQTAAGGQRGLIVGMGVRFTGFVIEDDQLAQAALLAQ
ncbi:MAG: PilZ domain-containing protein [Deltaproteobacteria bacterium]|nr:PilZ domain-containing protein [Deltaproteobacteria bacterium]